MSPTPWPPPTPAAAGSLGVVVGLRIDVDLLDATDLRGTPPSFIRGAGGVRFLALVVPHGWWGEKREPFEVPLTRERFERATTDLAEGRVLYLNSTELA